MKQIFVLGVCALFIACGSSTERGISAVTADSTAKGIAYNNQDTMPGAKAQAAPPIVAEVVPTTSSDSIVATPVAAGQAATTAATKPVTPPAAKPVTAPANDGNEDVKRGEALISKSDCLACHKVQDKLLGPSYKDVANKYPNNAATIAQLADKIKKGGSGVWGPIPMSPHPALSDDDAKAMVKYILSLK